ncbi:MAG TPA: TonB-dependent receptor [Allosphingosinicella sp.]
MNKLGLLNTTAIGTAVFGASMLFAAPAFAQPAAAQDPQGECTPQSPNYDPNTRNCVQPPEGTPGQTAPGSNPGTAPGDEEPTQAELNADAPEGEAILVTGSRIPRPQFEGTIPGAQVTAEQIETRAFTNVLDVLNDIPLVGPGASPFGTNGGQPSSLGVAFVDLLDLGTNRTLTLLNGRRFVSGNQATLFVQGNVTGAQVDLNVIPTALVNRADVLTVGGAVAYGSDAVAGVVNLILRDDYDGISFTALSGISEQGDAFVYRLSGVAGMNFMGDRGNIAVSLETNFDEGVQGNQRREFYLNPIAPTNFMNGGIRNPNFTPSLTVSATAGTGAFVPAGSDLIPNNIAGPGFYQDPNLAFLGGSILTGDTGVIFAPTGTTANVTFQGIATAAVPNPLTVGTSRPPVLYAVQAGNVNIVPGTQIAPAAAGCSVTNLTQFCNFAPNALPTGTATQQAAFREAVIATFAPQVGTGGTATQRTNLAIQLLAANRPTPREYLAANPNVDLNLFVGQFATSGVGGTGSQNFPTIANTDPATAALFPRRAVPIMFDAAGNVVTFSAGQITDPARQPSTTGGALGANPFFNPAAATVLRAEQRRHIANVFAHFDVTDNITVYTEGLYARIENTALQNNLSGNQITGNTTENAALVMNVNNPFLDATDRANLAAVGITNNFLLSRTNNDLAPGRNPYTNNSDTYRGTLGAKADFGVFGREQTFDVSFTYGRGESTAFQRNIRDIEFALAVDAVRDPVTNNIVCRAQIDPAAQGIPRGINAIEIVRETGADGVVVEKLVTRAPTTEQIANCRPLNVFGYGQSSQEARDYVIADIFLSNVNEQRFAQASLSGSIVDLPAGPIRYAVVGEYRRESTSFIPDKTTRFGESRFVAIAETQGYIQNYEFGGELRLPIFGENFNIPLFRNLDLTPGVRFVQQGGDAPDVLLLQQDDTPGAPPGQRKLITNESPSQWNTIWSLAGSWRPVRDLTFRANVTRSVRQASIVELFLGGQPSFINAFTEPCSTANINSGTRPATRKANCIAAVNSSGVLTGGQTAEQFLSTFVPSGSSVTGSFTGSPTLQPELGRSWTVGATATPRFIPGLQFGADYINVELENQIVPTSLSQALQTCFDSLTFPDTSEEVGVNVCDFFSRQGATDIRPFEIANGFTSGFINLGALRVKAINMNAQYNFNIDSLIGGGDLGRLELYANAYHLIDYLSAPTGNFADGALQSAGTFSRPDWEVQLRARYEAPNGFFGQWTANWQPETLIFSGGAPIPGTEQANEVQDQLGNPAFALHDATIGWRLGEEGRFGLQLTVANVFDKRAAGPFAAVYNSIGTGRIDDIGRRFRVQANLRF